MRLLELKDNGEFSLTRDIVNNKRPYAILSHTWGDDDEEVNFKDMTEGFGKTKAGYKKILFCGEQAARDGLQYCWVDTCCIDKSNNTEFSEAINSMFRWYRNAAKCYVYLSDVLTNDHDQVDPSLQSWQLAFRESRWFTRGWTLQELIAPPSVEFFGSNGKRLGNKKSLERQLHEITGIAVLALQGTALSAFSVDERMSWAENRETKREEDKAYSLLGIFDIYMPLIYGEGAKNAFSRLREELYKRPSKHQLDEPSTVSQATFNSTKRLKTPRGWSPSIPSRRDQNFLDPEPLFYSEYSVHCDNPRPILMHNRADASIWQSGAELPPETRKELVTRVSHSIDATTKQSLIDQLYFTKIDERLISLTADQGTTYRWFLTKPEYISWHDVTQQPVHGGFLWIKGNPGTGKSTLMKLLFEEAKLNAKGDSSQITLSFFVWGTVEEKSTTGLYRSLLHQLFEKAVELRDSLEWITADGARAIQRNGWREEALKQTLTHAVQRLGSRSLTIFVDALDECDKDQAAGMVCFFEELCNRAREAQVRLQICFSSRHYPTVVIQKGIEVTLEDEIGHTEDIEHYIKSKLRLGKSKQAESLQSEILEKSSSIFLWAVLVLDILNSEYPDRSVSIKKIRERLKEIPPKLTDLFEMILMRDGENLERLQVCLKWILFATRPLKPQELYFAIQLGLDKECLSYWDQEDVDLDQIKTFVRSSSKDPLRTQKATANRIEDRICGGNVYGLSSYSTTITPITTGIQIRQSNRAVYSRRCQCSCHRPGQCQTPRSLSDLIGSLFVGHTGIPWLSSSCDNRSCAHLYRYFSMRLQWFLPSWIGSRMVTAIISASTRDGPAFNLRIPAVRPKSDPIFSLVMRGDIEGIQSEFCKGSASPFDVDEAGYSLVWFALSAFNPRMLETCHFLLREGANPLDEESRDPKRLWTTFDCAWMLILGKQVSLSTALELRIIFDNSDQLKDPRFPLLHEIVLKLVNVDLLIYLDTFTGDIDQTDAYGRTALEWAVARNDVVAVRALLGKGADSYRGNWALSHSISGPASDRAIIESLTRFKRDIRTSNPGDGTIIEACQHNNPEAIRALLSLGADIDAQNNYGFTALHYAASWNRHECLAVLLESHADCSLQTNHGHNILHIAMANSDIRTLEILGEAQMLFRSEVIVCPKFTFEYIQRLRGQLIKDSVGRKWWRAWKKLLSRFEVVAVKGFGVLEPEKGWDDQDDQSEISYDEDEYEGTFVDAVEHIEAVEV